MHHARLYAAMSGVLLTLAALLAVSGAVGPALLAGLLSVFSWLCSSVEVKS